MGAKSRLQSRGPVSLEVYNRYNTHARETFEDVRDVYEEAARREEARARREADEEKAALVAAFAAA